MSHFSKPAEDVFWGEHEAAAVDPDIPLDAPPRPPHEDPSPCFTGRHNLFAFITAAQKQGLAVILRLGPYVCAELDFGGLPSRLRDIPGIRFRTSNQPFQRAMEKWVRLIASELHSRRLLASEGGPIILVQLENEYEMIDNAFSQEGKDYLQWAADLQRTLNFDVGAIMCVGAAEGVVETINSFYAHKEVARLRQSRPKEPPVWTECWTGWYDVWGSPHHVRPTADLLYAVARFVAVGGAGINYYMWMGGTNIGRSTMYLQKTSYDYDAPIDEFYGHTNKSRLLGKLHAILLEHFLPAFNSNRGSDPIPNEGVFLWGNLAFICNDDPVNPRPSGIPLCNDRTHDHIVAPRSVHLVDMVSGTLLFDTAAALPANERVHREPTRARELSATEWTTHAEAVLTIDAAPMLTKGRPVEVGDRAAELVRLTRGRSDYAWYASRFKVYGGSCLVKFEAGDYAQLFIGGRRVGASSLPLYEDRWRNRWNEYPDGEPGRWVHVKVDEVPNGEVDVCVLVASVGLIKADWQLREKENMQDEKKGLLSEVVFSGETGWTGRRVAPWTSVGGLAGEAGQWGRLPVGFDESEGRQGNNVPGWFCSEVRVARSNEWVLDLGGIGKGMFFVNGHLLGRFWDVVGTTALNGFHKVHGSPVEQTMRGEASQRYYHVPTFVVAEGQGDEEMCSLRIVLFVEDGAGPGGEVQLMEMRSVRNTGQVS